MAGIRKRRETGSPARDRSLRGAFSGTPSMEAVRGWVEDANAGFVAEHDPVDLPPTPRMALAVVACMDCRLTGRLDEALGLRPGDAYVIRVAGNTVAGSDDVTRSVAIAVLEMGVRNILVVGHTGCGMTRIDPLAFSEKMSARGVSRFALGFQPLREWLGLFRDEARNVHDTIEKIRTSPAIPRDVAVAGALIDTATCELTWLETTEPSDRAARP